MNEEGNVVADKAVEVAVTYIKKNNKLGVNADPVRVVGNRTDATGLLEQRKKTKLRKYKQIVCKHFLKFSLH